MKRIAVISTNPRKYFHLVNLLREYNIDFIVTASCNLLSNDVRVIITDNPLVKKEKPEITVLIDNDNYEQAIFKAMCMLKGKEEFNTLVIGIDPGATHGLAVLADGSPIILKLFNNTKLLLNYIKRLIDQFPAKIKIIRIGSNAKHYLKEIISELENLNFLCNVKIELVSESLPPPPYIKEYTLPNDIKSALSIALNKSNIRLLRGVRDED